MFTEISGDELRDAVNDFRHRICTEMKAAGKRQYSFPGGEFSGEGDNYEVPTSQGLLSIIIISDEERHSRYMHYINLNAQGASIAPDTEINIPKKLDRRIQILLAKNEGHRYICHRGKFTVNKSSLKKSVGLDHFDSRYGNVVQVREFAKVCSCIQIADLSSMSLFEDIALFANRVKSLKQQYRTV